MPARFTVPGPLATMPPLPALLLTAPLISNVPNPLVVRPAVPRSTAPVRARRFGVPPVGGLVTLMPTLLTAAVTERLAAIVFVPPMSVVSLMLLVMPTLLPLIVQPLERKVIEFKAVFAAKSLL